MKTAGFRRLFRNPFREHGLETEVMEEHAFHLEEKVAELVGQGMRPDEAERRAEAQFGSRERWQAAALAERRRNQTSSRRIEARDGLARDLLAAARGLKRRPGLPISLVLIIAVGTGVSISVLSIADAVLLRPVPFEHPDRIVQLRAASQYNDRMATSAASWLDWKDGQRSFEYMAAVRDREMSLLEGGGSTVPGVRVESDFFRIVGANAAMGRVLGPADDEPDARPVAVLSHRIWSSRFGSDPGVVGRDLMIEGNRVTVVGVLPRTFRFRNETAERDVFLNDPYLGDRTTRTPAGPLVGWALLREGVSPEAARAQMNDVAARLAREYPDQVGERSSRYGAVSINLVPFREMVVESAYLEVMLLAGTALLLVLVVSGTAAGMILTRTLDRTRELAVRATLGATRARLAYEALLETALIVLTGVGLGSAVAILLLPVVKALAPVDVPYLSEATVDGRLAAVVLLLGSIVWLLTGLLPAARAGTVRPFQRMQGRLHRVGRRSRLPRAVVVGQLAGAVFLVSAAMLLLRSYVAMTHVDPGVEAENVYTVHLRLPYQGFVESVDSVAEQPWMRFYRLTPLVDEYAERVTESLRALPGVLAAAVTSHPPFWGRRAGNFQFGVVADSTVPRYGIKWVDPQYASVVGLRLRAGRWITARDTGESEAAVVVNESFVRAHLSEAVDPVGARLRIWQNGTDPGRDYRVVGVVADVKQFPPDNPVRPYVYFSRTERRDLWTNSDLNFPLYHSFVVKVDPAAPNVLQSVREIVLGSEPSVSISEFASLVSLERELTAQPRFFLVLFGTFAAVALLLAAAGTYVLLAQDVRHHRHEIGVRQALGASRTHAAGRVVLDGIRLSAYGLALGLVGAWFGARLLEAYVVGVAGWTPGPAIAIVATLLAAGTVASWLPSRTASRLDPMEVMRAD